MTTATVLALRRGLVYDGDGNFFRAIHPIPVLTRASCDWIPESCEDSAHSAPMIFREDSFDPITRIRRGRLYHRDTQQGAKTLPAENVHNYPFGPHIGITDGQWGADSWYTPYTPYTPSAKGRASDKLGSQVQLGNGGVETVWRVVQTERILSYDILFTLRAVSFLGSLPRIADTIESLQRKPVDAQSIQAALDQVVDAFHAQQPQPLADVCREATRAVLAAWIGGLAEAKDLGEVIPKVPEDQSLLRRAAYIINRLHPRGKSAEKERQARMGNALRPVVDEDAETCVNLLGLIVREIGWAAS